MQECLPFQGKSPPTSKSSLGCERHRGTKYNTGSPRCDATSLHSLLSLLLLFSPPPPSYSYQTTLSRFLGVLIHFHTVPSRNLKPLTANTRSHEQLSMDSPSLSSPASGNCGRCGCPICICVFFDKPSRAPLTELPAHPTPLWVSQMLLREVDGLQTGLRYIDAVIDSGQSVHSDTFPMRRNEPILSSTDIIRRYVASAEPIPRPIHGPKRQSQWVTLLEVRESSRSLYIKFTRSTFKHKSRSIQRLRGMYNSPKNLLDTGMTTWRDLIASQEPQSLREIFAFTCLSYLLTKLLHSKGRMKDFPVLSGALIWPLAVKKMDDRLLYDRAWKLLWPEVAADMKIHEEHHCLQPDAHSKHPVLSLTLSEAASDGYGSGYIPGLLEHANDLVKATSLHEDLKFRDFLRVKPPQLQ